MIGPDMEGLFAALAGAVERGGRKLYDPATGRVVHEVGPVIIYAGKVISAYIARVTEDQFRLTIYRSSGGHVNPEWEGDGGHLSLEWEPVPLDRVPRDAAELLLEAANLGEEARAPWEDYEGGAAE